MGELNLHVDLTGVDHAKRSIQQVDTAAVKAASTRIAVGVEHLDA